MAGELDDCFTWTSVSLLSEEIPSSFISREIVFSLFMVFSTFFLLINRPCLQEDSSVDTKGRKM